MAISIDEYKNKMENTLKIFHEELSRLRTGRATPSLLEPLFVEAYNSKMKISELATVNAPEPKLLTVQVWDKSMVQNVEKSIRDSELGLNPSTDGQLIRVPLPDLTEERRKEMVKIVGNMVEEGHVAIRNIRRDSLERIRTLDKDKEISQDDGRRAQQELQTVTDSFISEMDSIKSQKEKEVMEV